MYRLKKSSISLITLFFLQLSVVNAQGNIQQEFKVPANKGYAEPFTPGNPGISIRVGNPETIGVVNRWANKDKNVAWYLYQKNGEYDFYLENQVTAGKSLKFLLTVTPCYEMGGFKKIVKEITLNGTGNNQEDFIAKINVPQTGYFKYEMQAITDPESAITIQSLVFKSGSEGAQVNHTKYQSSPSVHLAFSSTAPTTKAYDWIYEEILVPEGADPLATYYMSLGFYRGYMGIQTNSVNERRVLFSVWDSKDAENDKSITKGDYVSLVDKGENTTTNSFGGEGTGGQSYINAMWKTGTPVKFLMNVLRQEDTTVVLSAWYQLQNEDWVYVASWRAPGEKKLFDGFYSFIENYGHTNGQLRREAYYYNAWGKEAVTGKWVNFNKVRFSNTDGKEGQRVDYEQGVSPRFPDRFYMASGGYTPTIKTKNEMPLADKNFMLNTKPFADRVLQALENEKNRKKQ